MNPKLYFTKLNCHLPKMYEYLLENVHYLSRLVLWKTFLVVNEIKNQLCDLTTFLFYFQKWTQIWIVICKKWLTEYFLENVHYLSDLALCKTFLVVNEIKNQHCDLTPFYIIFSIMNPKLYFTKLNCHMPKMTDWVFSRECPLSFRPHTL